MLWWRLQASAARTDHVWCWALDTRPVLRTWILPSSPSLHGMPASSHCSFQKQTNTWTSGWGSLGYGERGSYNGQRDFKEKNHKTFRVIFRKACCVTYEVALTSSIYHTLQWNQLPVSALGFTVHVVDAILRKGSLRSFSYGVIMFAKYGLISAWSNVTSKTETNLSSIKMFLLHE